MSTFNQLADKAIGLIVGGLTVYAFMIAAEPDTYPYHPEYAKNTMLITWTHDPDIIEPEMRKYEEEHGIDTDTYEVNGLAKFGGDFCTILAPDPKAEDEVTAAELQTLGHEFLHCMRGKWHD